MLINVITDNIINRPYLTFPKSRSVLPKVCLVRKAAEAIFLFPNNLIKLNKRPFKKCNC